MNKELYAKVKESARYCRSLEIRQKINLFLDVIREGKVQQVCKRYGVHRSRYHRWWKRFQGSGFEVGCLEARSRRPKRSPQRVSKKIVQLVRRYRLEFRYGPERIRYYLIRNHKVMVSQSTIARLIQRQGWLLKKYRTKKVNPHKKRYNLPWPGMNVQLDIKYVPQLIEGEQYYEFNAIDDCTRWRHAKAFKEKGILQAVQFVRELVQVAPFEIQCIQTDNDQAFTYRLSPHSFDKRHPFGSTLEALGIRHRCIPPGQKELNGKVERSHRTDDEEFYWKPPLHNFGLLQSYLTQWIWEYNHDRPHGSLNGLTPMEKLMEKTLLPILILAIKWGKIEILEPQEKIKRSIFNTYLKYLDWIHSDPFHVADVMNYYTFIIYQSLACVPGT